MVGLTRCMNIAVVVMMGMYEYWEMVAGEMSATGDDASWTWRSGAGSDADNKMNTHFIWELLI